jgi:hypothetical protein
MDNSPWIEKLENASCCEQEKKEFLRLFEFLDPSGTLLEHLKKQTQEQQQTHVYNESAIGYLLKRNGYELEYERKIQGSNKTPDWHIKASSSNPEFIVEVFTSSANSSEKSQQKERQITLLKNKLEAIKFDGHIILCIKNSSKLDSSKISKIKREIEKNLNKILAIRDRGQIDDIEFEYYLSPNHNTGTIGSYVSILPSEDDVKELDEKRFFNKISAKVKKYEQYPGPLVVSIFTDAMHQKGILENLGKVNSYLKNKSSLSAILWVDRCHPFVDGWIINIVHNHNSNSRINCILEGGEYINGDTSSSHYRIYPKKKLASCKQYEFHEFLRKTPPLPALLENNPCIQRCHYWLTPIHVKIEFLLAPTSDKATSSGYMDRLLRIPMENA